MTEPTDNPRPPKPKRRWLRYSLRSLLVAITIGGILLGLWVRSAERQRRAVAVIENAGGFVFYDNGVAQAPEWVAGLLDKDYIASPKHVSIQGRTEAEWLSASQLRTVRILSMKGDVTTSRLSLFASHDGVRVLDLQNTTVTDEAIVSLTKLRRLQVLFLADTDIGDVGLATIGSLKGLFRGLCG